MSETGILYNYIMLSQDGHATLIFSIEQLHIIKLTLTAGTLRSFLK